MPASPFGNRRTNAHGRGSAQGCLASAAPRTSPVGTAGTAGQFFSWLKSKGTVPRRCCCLCCHEGFSSSEHRDEDSQPPPTPGKPMCCALAPEQHLTAAAVVPGNLASVGKGNQEEPRGGVVRRVQGECEPLGGGGKGAKVSGSRQLVTERSRVCGRRRRSLILPQSTAGESSGTFWSSHCVPCSGPPGGSLCPAL